MEDFLYFVAVAIAAIVGGGGLLAGIGCAVSWVDTKTYHADYGYELAREHGNEIHSLRQELAAHRKEINAIKAGLSTGAQPIKELNL